MIRRVYEVAHDELLPDPHNMNTGTKRGAAMLRKSLERVGPGRSIVLDRNNAAIAGNKTLETAVELGIPVIVVESTGESLVAVKRVDLDLSDPRGKGREMAIADNRVGELNFALAAEVAIANLDDGGPIVEYYDTEELVAVASTINLDRTEAPPQEPLDLGDDDAGDERSAAPGDTILLGDALWLEVSREADERDCRLAERLVSWWERQSGGSAEWSAWVPDAATPGDDTGAMDVRFVVVDDDHDRI